jgi:hypothetical protein
MKTLRIPGQSIVIFLFCLQITSLAQDFEKLDPGIQVRHPIPLKTGQPDYYSLNDHVADLIVKNCELLDLPDILVCILVDTVKEKPDSLVQRRMIDLQNANRYTEAFVILETEMHEKEIPSKAGGADLFSNGTSKTSTMTTLTVRSCLANLQTRENLGPCNFIVTEVGGSDAKTKLKVFKELDEKVKNELKRLYWLSADIDSIKNGSITLPVGTKQGIENKMIFDLVEPDRVWQVGGKKVITPGSVVGWAAVADTAKESCRLHVLRQWDRCYPQSWVVEHKNPIWAAQFYCVPPSTASFTSFGAILHTMPISRLDFGASVSVSRVTDSFLDDDIALGFGGFWLWRFLNKQLFDLSGKVGADFDFPFRKDDDGQWVRTTLFSMYLNLVVEYAASARSDLVLAAGYRFAAKSQRWKYSIDEITYPAYWEGKVPAVDNSGIMVSVGYKFFIF